MDKSQQLVTKKTISNNFYTEQLVLGAYPLTQNHTNELKSQMPQQAEFIDDLAGVLRADGIAIQACLLAHFAVLKEMVDNNIYSQYIREGFSASEVKFSFVKVSNNNVLVRYETEEQQMLRRAFLTFNMRSANRKKVQSFLAKSGLQMATMGDCGCCILPSEQLSSFEESNLYEASNVVRSYFNSEAIETLIVPVQELGSIDADICQADIYAMTKLSKVIASLAKIDQQDGCSTQYQPDFFAAVDVLNQSYQKVS